ncbi:hypothetical protein [Acinetobacter larvae]|uniref:Phage antitermination protein Q n=1 Tax=Acinetobacter larvae TaxID=1789224 RepID=A0A1B2LZ85_9GAMM|nr:hypothetical protein [Acinetobacter larvae]AOA58260.1 hypothetical protein BFG52_07760 [Acinetobacter larvae]
MNAAVTIMQATDWGKYDLEGWLYQFGAWQNTVQGTCGKSLNPIAAAMDQAVVKRKKLKLGIRKKRQITADAMLSDIDFMPIKKQTPKDIVCEITDNEARAVQRLVLDLRGQSDVMDEWLDAIVDRYFYFNSWSEMVIKVGYVDNPTIIRSKYGAEQDVKCGLAVLHSRYKFIAYK